MFTLRFAVWQSYLLDLGARARGLTTSFGGHFLATPLGLHALRQKGFFLFAVGTYWCRNAASYSDQPNGRTSLAFKAGNGPANLSLKTKTNS